MMFRTKGLSFILAIMLLMQGLLVIAAPKQAQAQDEYDLLRSKWFNLLTGGNSIDTNDPDIAARINAFTTDANTHWSNLNTSTGRTYLWSDQANGATNSIAIASSYTRLYLMAKAYRTYGSTLYGNTAIRDDIINGLDWLYQNWYNTSKPQFTNWFDWQINIPRTLNDTLVLMYDDVTSAAITDYMDVSAYFNPEPTTGGSNASLMVGANLVWDCSVVGLRGILTKDASQLVLARDSISPVFEYADDATAGDGGFFSDGSFIQHSGHPYTGGYGAGLLGTLVDFIYLLNGSTWTISDPNLNHMYHWIYDSFEPVLYDGMFMDMVRGREISRIAAQGKGISTVAAILSLAQSASPADSLRYKQMVKYWIQRNSVMNVYESFRIRDITLMKELLNNPSIPGRGELIQSTVFPGMDRVVHLRPGYGFGISMYSSRIENFEYVNNENLKGWYTGSGMTQLYNEDQSQYIDDYWATVNKFRLPGTTVETRALPNYYGHDQKSSTSWVGGVSMNGLYSTVGMDMTTYKSSLVAKKSWFLLDDEIVALGAGIMSTDNRTIETIVDNRKIKPAGNNGLIVNGSAQSNTLGWNQTLTGVEWAHLKGNTSNSDIGYYFPQAVTLKGLREARTDAWSSINTNGSSNVTTPVTRNYMTMWMDHGTNPMNQTYAYVLLPNKSSTEVSGYAANPDIEIIENSTSAQAVRDQKLNITGVNFWQTALKTVGFITSHSKASVMVRENVGKELEVAVSDPTQENTGTITLELDRSATEVVYSDSAIRVTQTSPTIKLSIDVNGSKGKTFRVKFNLAEHGQMRLQAADDALVRDGLYANNSYGSEKLLYIKDSADSGFSRKSYVKFKLPDNIATVNSAKLRVYGMNDQDSATVNVQAFGVTNDDWTEGGITWNNAPSPQPTVLDTVYVNAVEQYYELDVTAFVQSRLAGKVVSLALESTSNQNKNVRFNTKELGIGAPELLLSTNTMTVSTAADAYVKDGSDTAVNFGSETKLYVKDSLTTGVNRKAYLMFDLPTGLTSVHNAKVRLYGKNDQDSATANVKVYGVLSDSWTESGIVWNNAPVRLGAEEASFDVNGLADQYYELDVTNFVQNRLANGVVSLMLESTENENKNIRFNSRESGNRAPVLIIR